MVVAVMALLASLLASVAAAAPPDADEEVDFWLTILHNNDGESALLPDDVLDADDNVIGTQGGVAYFARVRQDAEKIAKKKPRGSKAKRGVVFVSSGDNFLASPSFSASLADGVFYDARALDMLKYDAIDIGNHEFDFGPDLLAEFISEGFRKPGKPPYLSANLDFTGEPSLQALFDDGAIASRTVVKERGEEIGIVGLTTPNLPFISSPRNVVVDPDVVAVVQAEIDSLEAEGVNKIILISHLQDVDGDVALAGQLSGIDVMIAGGGDELLANMDDLLLPSDDPSDVFGSYPIDAKNADGDRVPVVTTSGQYGYLGNLVVGFDEDGVVVDVDEDRSGPIRVVSEGVGADGVKPVNRYDRRVVEPVADFVADLADNVIATSEVDLDGTRSPGVRTMETNEGNLIADSQRWQAGQLAAEFGVPVPDVAIQNGGGIRNDSIIPAGNITELDTFDMVPFANFLTVFPEISRDTFKAVLENAVSRIDPPAIPGGSGRFAQVSGFSFTFNTTGTPYCQNPDCATLEDGNRVTDVVLDDGTVLVAGGDVVPGDPISVTVVDFTARGGDEYPWGDAEFTVLGVSYQQALSNYIQAPAGDGGLGGLISAADYPEGGEGRITQLP